MSSEPSLERVRQWVLSINPRLKEIGLDTELIDSRIVDSLQFIEMILLIEEIRGRDIPSNEIRPEAFRTLRAIRDGLLLSPAE
jgi:acyl carrier protein